jgi:hypothetical protein
MTQEKRLLRPVLVACVLSLAAGPGAADVLKRACLKSDRRTSGPAVCTCIQSLANGHLSASDQRRAARLFAKPDKVMDYKQARKDTSKRRFWERYRDWGNAAAKNCRV